MYSRREALAVRNTTNVGNISTAQVMAALIRMGKFVLLPFGEGRRYDLVVEEDDGRFVRVQCKTGRIWRGAIWFAASSVDSRSGDKVIRKGYAGEADWFGVYCPANGKSYLVPVADVPSNGAALRLEPPRNGQQKHIRWAKDYEIGSAPEVGDNSELSFVACDDILLEE
jgi:hypothetical protein